jgi:hypothetical protein
MIVAACGADSELLELSDEATQIAVRQAAAYDAAGLVHQIALCDAVARNARGATTSRALFDALVVRLALSRNIADVAALVGAAGAGAAPAPAPAKKKEGRPPLRPPPAPADPAPSAVESKPAAAPAPATAATTPAPAPAETPPPAPTVPDDRPIWPAVLDFAARSHSDLARVEHLRYKSFDGRTLHLAVDELGADLARFLKTQTPRIEDLVKRATGRRVIIELEAAAAPRTPPVVPAQVIETVTNLPEVSRAAELFDATVVDVQEDPAAADQRKDGG